MSSLTDTEIETIVLSSIEKLFEETDLILTFSSIKDDGIEILLNEDGKWYLNHATDVLSLVVYFLQPVPNYNSDDNVCISTIMKLWNKSAGWVRSFQCGINNQNNNSTSISGWYIGHQVRRKIDVCIEENRK